MEAPSAETTKLYCNRLAIEKGVDPVGHAGSFKTLMVIEAPLPWKKNMYSEVGILPQQVMDLYKVRRERYNAGEGYHHALLMVASDPAYSQRGYRRIMYYDRPSDCFAEFRKVEYSVPDDQFGSLIWALAEERETLDQYEQYRDPTHDATREILICTHGTVDAACAKFGYPLYNHMRTNHASDDIRVWRVSHFGGQIGRAPNDPHRLYGHYRGWAGLHDSFLQAAERELWMQHGWAWLQMPKSGVVLEKDNEEEPQSVSIRLDYRLDDQPRSYTATVEVHQRISTPYSTASEETYAYEQYKVREIQIP